MNHILAGLGLIALGIIGIAIDVLIIGFLIKAGNKWLKRKKNVK